MDSVILSVEPLEKYPHEKSKTYARCTGHHIAGKPLSGRILWNLAH